MYDLDKINVTVSNEGTIVHVYSDRHNSTSERTIFMLGAHSAMKSVVDGNPVADDFQIKEVFRMVTRQEADELRTYLWQAGRLMEKGLIKAFDLRRARTNAMHATFMIRFSSEGVPA